MLYSYNQLYRHIYMQKHNDDFNERTKTLLWKNIPLTLYSEWLERIMMGLCVRGEFDTEQKLQHIDPQLFWL